MYSKIVSKCYSTIIGMYLSPIRLFAYSPIRRKVSIETSLAAKSVYANLPIFIATALRCVQLIIVSRIKISDLRRFQVRKVNFFYPCIDCCVMFENSRLHTKRKDSLKNYIFQMQPPLRVHSY